MAIVVQTQRSCARAWVEASRKLIREGDEAYNVLIEVTEPVTHDAQDVEVIKFVNTFLCERGCGANPVSTVCNTIFPQTLLQAHGSPKFYDVYREKVFGKLTKSKQWGRYFERMTRKIDRKGQPYNPLDKIIEKLKKQNGAKTPYKAAYELTIYDPALDRKRYRNAPCLSYLSFKRHPDLGLTLTAVYRNQTYITRCLGNLIGLGRLQAFVAKEAGLKVGTLTCLSTHAELDTSSRWGIKDARKLVQDAENLLKVGGVRSAPY
jgi:thymidylate synthase